MNHKLAVIIALGVLVRIILIPISAHPFDINIWYNLSTKVISNGPLSVEIFPPHNGYYMVIPVAYLYDWLSSLFSTGPIPIDSLPSALNFYPNQGANYVPDFLFNLLWKLPNFLSEVVIAILIYKIVGTHFGEKYRCKAVFLWFLNPFVIWVSAVWGQWDVVAVMFSFLGFYFLLKNRILLSSICLLLGVFTKIFPVLFLLPIILYLIKSKNFIFHRKRNVIVFLLPFVISSFVIVLLFSG